MYRLFDTKDEPITTISTGIYIINTYRASYLDIKNPKNPINVIASIPLPQKYYEEIIKGLAKYNEKLINSYKLDGTIIGISYKGSRYSQLEKSINKKPVEILPDPNLKNKVEIVTKDIDLYKLINYRGPVGIIIKVPVFQTY